MRPESLCTAGPEASPEVPKKQKPPGGIRVVPEGGEELQAKLRKIQKANGEEVPDELQTESKPELGPEASASCPSWAASGHGSSGMLRGSQGAAGPEVPKKPQGGIRVVPKGGEGELQAKLRKIQKANGEEVPDELQTESKPEESASASGNIGGQGKVGKIDALAPLIALAHSSDRHQSMAEFAMTLQLQALERQAWKDGKASVQGELQAEKEKAACLIEKVNEKTALLIEELRKFKDLDGEAAEAIEGFLDQLHTAEQERDQARLRLQEVEEELSRARADKQNDDHIADLESKYGKMVEVQQQREKLMQNEMDVLK